VPKLLDVTLSGKPGDRLIVARVLMEDGRIVHKSHRPGSVGPDQDADARREKTKKFLEDAAGGIDFSA
jgi:hypothetical protein